MIFLKGDNMRPRKNLSESLIKYGYITEEQLEECLPEVDENSGRTLEKVLLEKKYVDEMIICDAKSRMYYLPICDITQIKYDERTISFLKVFKKENLEMNCCIPFGFSESNQNILMVAFGDVPEDSTIDMVKFKTGCDVEVYLGAPGAILAKIDEMFSEKKTEETAETNETVETDENVEAVEPAEAVESSPQVVVGSARANSPVNGSGIIKSGDKVSVEGLEIGGAVIRRETSNANQVSAAPVGTAGSALIISAGRSSKPDETKKTESSVVAGSALISATANESVKAEPAPVEAAPEVPAPEIPVPETPTPEAFAAAPINTAPAAPVNAPSEIERYDVSEEWAHSGIIKAGDFYYIGYCVGNIGGTIEEQINGAFDHMEKRLKMVGLTLENVVQMDCLFRDVWNIPVMEKIIRERFNGKYPVRKSIQTEFAHVGGREGLQFQVDGVAYAGK